VYHVCQLVGDTNLISDSPTFIKLLEGQYRSFYFDWDKHCSPTSGTSTRKIANADLGTSTRKIANADYGDTHPAERQTQINHTVNEKTKNHKKITKSSKIQKN